MRGFKLRQRRSGGVRHERGTLSPHAIGLVCLVVTSTGWGLNWPAMKLLLREWPPLFSRGLAGLAAAGALALVA